MFCKRSVTYGSLPVLALAFAVSGCNMDSSFSDMSLARSSPGLLVDGSGGEPVSGPVPGLPDDPGNPGVSGTSGESGVSGPSGVSDQPGIVPGSPGTPTSDGGPVSSCGTGQQSITAEFKCHSPGDRQPDRIHCNFKIPSIQIGGREHHLNLSSHFDPSALVDGLSCTAIQAGSLIARLQDIAPINGEVHFHGQISACVDRPAVLNCKDKRNLKIVLELAYLKQMGLAGGTVLVEGDSVRKGNDRIALGDGTDVKAGNYCIRGDHEDADDDAASDQDSEDMGDPTLPIGT